MKLLQWNVWYKEDVGNIIKTISEVDADILCLQELTVNHPHYNRDINVPQHIADTLGFDLFFKEAERNSGGENAESVFGNAILSRFPLRGHTFRYIQESSKVDGQETDYSQEGRVYVEASVHVHDREICVGTTHMSYTDQFKPTPLKEAETNRLLEILNTKRSGFIFTGDLNALPDSYTVTEISKILENCGPAIDEKTWTTKPFSYNGFKANTLDWRLDYCFSTHDIKIRSARVITTEFSDHLPILLEM